MVLPSGGRQSLIDKVYRWLSMPIGVSDDTDYFVRLTPMLKNTA